MKSISWLLPIILCIGSWAQRMVQAVPISQQSKQRLIQARQAAIDAQARVDAGAPKATLTVAEKAFNQTCGSVKKIEGMVDDAGYFYICHLGKPNAPVWKMRK